MARIEAIDLFCGAGGLTAGLLKAGVRVRAGYDIDENCRYAYETNNRAKFVANGVEGISGKELSAWYRPGSIRLLAGCAPCQPFSTYNHGKDTREDRKWPLLYAFARLISELQPELVTMENVPDVTKHEVYDDFVLGLKKNGYFVWADRVNCVEYGLAQDRKRHVLLASRLGPISLIPPSDLGYARTTVHDAIGQLPALSAGEISLIDPLHRAATLSPLNLQRIKKSKPGGSWRDWPPSLRAACHLKASGKSYPSVYGRMSWEKPSPTMTTLCYGFGNGRFGHPDQHRGISLREAAILQSFPDSYKFSPSEKIAFKTVGRMIGNAVPVRLGEVIGRSILQHTSSVSRGKKSAGAH